MARILFYCCAALTVLRAQQGVAENATQRVSDHVHAIVGFPNVAIVAGARATLVVDTGMGPRNGAVIVRELAKLPKTPALYITTTHFHPEHATGDQAFPPGAILVRNTRQQEEMDRRGQEYIDLFSSRSAQNKELLADVKLRAPDVVFDRELRLDLGGVTARLFWIGPAHTQGDLLIWVEQDRTLISGDIVQNRLVPNFPNEDASVKGWLEVLDRLAPLNPRYVIPDHGALGDGSLIAKQRGFMLDVQARALALKRQGTGAEEAGKALQVEIKARYPDWENLNPLANFVRRIYAEAQ